MYKNIHHFFKTWSSTKRLILAALLATLSALLQSAGGWIPGIGIFISPFSTMPILLSIIISSQHGIFTYFLTCFLLILIEPSELFIFPFTTGLIGLTIGWALRNLDKKILIILIGGFSLLFGICIPLYGLGFPVLGPAFPFRPTLKILLFILIFSFCYVWIWLKFSLYILIRIEKFLSS